MSPSVVCMPAKTCSQINLYASGVPNSDLINGHHIKGIFSFFEMRWSSCILIARIYTSCCKIVRLTFATSKPVTIRKMRQDIFPYTLPILHRQPYYQIPFDCAARLNLCCGSFFSPFVIKYRCQIKTLMPATSAFLRHTSTMSLPFPVLLDSRIIGRLDG